MIDEKEFLQDLMLLARAAHLALQNRVIEEAPEDLSPAKLNILRVLGRREKQSVNDLARFLGQTKAAASQNVERLFQAKLVRRRTDTQDRRCTWISLTPQGKEVLEQLERRQAEILAIALPELPEPAARDLAQSMRQLAFALLCDSVEPETRCLQCCAYNSAGCVQDGNGWTCQYMLEDALAARQAASSPSRAARRPLSS